MCTAATYRSQDFYFGRTFDYEFNYGEEVTVTPRNYPFPLRHQNALTEHYAMIGIAHMAGDYPLYYDAVNEKGLGMAGLNFPGNAVYSKVQTGKDNIAQFEFIPWILGQCANVQEARVLLSHINLVDTPFNEKYPVSTLHWILADKEEVGSSGNTGLNSDFLLHIMADLAENMGAHFHTVLRHSICLSSDVNAAYDPTFASVYEERNACYINRGCVLTKYTGARGKSGTNDASAETMAQVIRIMDENGVYWQTGELGAVDVGGGGTIAQFVASMDVDVVDLGVPILSMHAPFELASKLDVYNTYRAFCAFYR